MARRYTLQLTLLLVCALSGNACTRVAPSSDAMSSQQTGAVAGPTSVTQIATDVAHPESVGSGSAESSWDPIDRSLVSFAKGEAWGIQERFFLEVSNELKFAIPYFLLEHADRPLSISALLEYAPLWYEQTFPDGTVLRVHDLASGELDEPGVMNLQIDGKAITGFLIYPDASHTRFELSGIWEDQVAWTPSLPFPHAKSALFATQMLHKDFTRFHGRFPHDFQELATWRRVTPSSALSIGKEFPGSLPVTGFFISHQTDPLQAMTGYIENRQVELGTHITFLHRKGHAAKDALKPQIEPLAQPEAALTAEGFDPFLFAEVL